MYQFPVGIMLDSLRMPIPEALEQAKALGADGIQVYATEGEMAPENMTPALRREFRERCAALGLQISALVGDLGGFADVRRNPSQIERSKRIMELARDLGCDVVTTHIGVIPDDPAEERFGIFMDACGRLGEFGEEIGATFAIETGPERAKTLRAFLDKLGSRGVGVNYDPANLAMVTQDDPVAGVHTLAPYIVHTHAKDGKNLRPADPMQIYHQVDHVSEGGDYFIELPLGQGDVDWPNYLRALEDIGFRGYLTIEREVGEDPVGDIGMAVTFLREQMV